MSTHADEDCVSVFVHHQPALNFTSSSSRVVESNSVPSEKRLKIDINSVISSNHSNKVMKNRIRPKPANKSNGVHQCAEIKQKTLKTLFQKRIPILKTIVMANESLHQFLPMNQQLAWVTMSPLFFYAASSGN